jgi:hypothetical protein
MSLEYIAGFFDGEGSIGIYKISRTGGYRLRTQLTQNITPDSESVMIELQSRFGGNIARMRAPIYKRGAAYNWQLNADVAAGFLKQIEPYLILKKDQAVCALAWQSGRPLPSRNAKGKMVAFTQRPLDAGVVKLMKALKCASIQEVMDNQADLVDIVAELGQIVCVKG